MSKVKVSKIKIQLTKDDIAELSLEQAKELYEALGELFEKKTAVVSSPVIVDRYVYSAPYRGTYWYGTASNSTSYKTIEADGELTTFTYSLLNA